MVEREHLQQHRLCLGAYPLKRVRLAHSVSVSCPAVRIALGIDASIGRAYLCAGIRGSSFGARVATEAGSAGKPAAIAVSRCDDAAAARVTQSGPDSDFPRNASAHARR
jgi:hypothetical protein